MKLFGPTLLMIAQYTTIIVSPLVNLLVVRYLGVESFGYYASAIAITSFFVLLADFGLQQSILHLNAQNPSPTIVKKGLILGLIYTLGAYLFTALWFNLFDYVELVKILGLLLGISYFRTIIVSILSAGLQVEGKYTRIAVWNLNISTSQWLTTLLVMFAGGGIYTLILLPLIIGLFIALLMLFIEGKHLKVFARNTHSTSSYSDLARNSVSFGLTGSMYQIYHRSDGAILSAARNPIEVGQYTVAFKIMELFYQFPGVLFNQILYPKYFAWSQKDPARLQFYYQMMNKIVFTIGMIATIFVLLFGTDLIRIIFGESQGDSAYYLFLMSFSVPLFFIASSMGSLLTTGGYLKTKIKIQMVVAILNVALNIIFVPIYGAVAAAILVVLTNVFLIIGYGAYISLDVYKGLFLRKKSYLFVMIQCAILCLPFFHLLGDQLLFKSIEFILYFLGIVLTGFLWVNKKEKEELLSLIKMK